MQCDDCHVPQLTASGDRYSIHDHKFDFSQPPNPCTECHSPGEVDEASQPPHQFNIQPVRFEKNMTLEEACLRCHEDKGMDWVEENIPTLKFQL